MPSKRFFTSGSISVRALTVTAIMTAMAYVLMLLEFSVPFVPSFLKFDFSDLPAFLAAFAISPAAGVSVELLKNLLHLPFTTTGGVGELANFLVGAALVLPAGWIYSSRRTRSGAAIGAVLGTLTAGMVSIPVNYYITYPFYTNFMPMDAILGMYQAIIPAADTLLKALLIVNLPFTVVKGVINLTITFLIYKPLSPLLKGTKNPRKTS